MFIIFETELTEILFLLYSNEVCLQTYTPTPTEKREVVRDDQPNKTPTDRRDSVLPTILRSLV